MALKFLSVESQFPRRFFQLECTCPARLPGGGAEGEDHLAVRGRVAL